MFGCFARAEDLEAITPPELRSRIQAPLPIPLKEGALFDDRLRIWGVLVRWRTRINLWKPPTMFVDEQNHGPYAPLEPAHRFSDTPDGGTRIDDHVRSGLPLGPLGAGQLDRIFRCRQERVQALLMGAGSS